MTDFILPQNQLLRIAFVGSDISIRVRSGNERGDTVAAGTYLYGPGKAGMMGNSTPREDGLMHIFAALAKGESMSLKFMDHDGAPRIATLSPPRPQDKITISSNEDGDLLFTVEGQDLGFESLVSVDIGNMTGGEVPTRSLYNGLHNYLTEFGAPKR